MNKFIPALLVLCTSIAITGVVIGESLYIYLNAEADSHKDLTTYAKFKEMCSDWEIRPDVCDQITQELNRECGADTSEADCKSGLIIGKYRAQLKQEIAATNSFVLVAFACSVICMGPACGCIGALLDEPSVAPVLTIVYFLASFCGFAYHLMQTISHGDNWSSMSYHLYRTLAWALGVCNALLLFFTQYREFVLGEKLSATKEEAYASLVLPPRYPNYGSLIQPPKPKGRSISIPRKSVESETHVHEEEEFSAEEDDTACEHFGYGQESRPAEVHGYGGGLPPPPLPPPNSEP